MAANYRVHVRTEAREDGGLRVWSDEVPELVLSGADPGAVLRDLPVALAQILGERLGRAVEIEELTDLPAPKGRPLSRAHDAREFVARAA